MTWANVLEAVFCPARYKERQRLEPLLERTARDMGAQRLSGDHPLADVVRDVARDMGMPAAVDTRLVPQPPHV